MTQLCDGLMRISRASPPSHWMSCALPNYKRGFDRSSCDIVDAEAFSYSPTHDMAVTVAGVLGVACPAAPVAGALTMFTCDYSASLRAILAAPCLLVLQACQILIHGGLRLETYNGCPR